MVAVPVSLLCGLTRVCSRIVWRALQSLRSMTPGLAGGTAYASGSRLFFKISRPKVAAKSQARPAVPVIDRAPSNGGPLAAQTWFRPSIFPAYMA